MERARTIIMALLVSSLYVLCATYALTLVGCGGRDGGEEAAAPGEMSASARAGEEIFNRQCVSCHTVGEGQRIGPDLKDVHTRRERAWLNRWMTDPMGMAQTDPIGRELFAQFNNVPMPPTNLSEEQIAQVLAYIEFRSGAEVAAAADDDHAPTGASTSSGT